jgi:hypothetical protein
MSPPSLTKARSSDAAAVMCASNSSATAPATAAIGVTNWSANGVQAATMRRATGPSTAGHSWIGRRSTASSSHSSGRVAGKRRPAAS